MNKKEKQIIVNSVLDSFSKSKGLFIVNFKDVDSFRTSDLRKDLFRVNGKLVVVKNSLLRLAAQKNDGLSQLNQFFKDQIALVYAFGDLFQTVSLVDGFLKKQEAEAGFKVGFVEKVILKDRFHALSKVKTEKEVYGKLCGSLKAAIVNLVFTLKQVGEKLNQ
jgi:large subunit ribosomal protein L10